MVGPFADYVTTVDCDGYAVEVQFGYTGSFVYVREIRASDLGVVCYLSSARGDAFSEMLAVLRSYGVGESAQNRLFHCYMRSVHLCSVFSELLIRMGHCGCVAVVQFGCDGHRLYVNVVPRGWCGCQCQSLSSCKGDTLSRMVAILDTFDVCEAQQQRFVHAYDAVLGVDYALASA